MNKTDPMNKTAPIGFVCGLALATLFGLAAQASAQPAHLVKNINTGRHGWQGSDPSELVEVSGVLYFVRFESTSGYELWRSDGTPEGTRLVKDIQPGVEDLWYLRPRGLAPFGNALLFGAMGELWRSDGTNQGTVPLTAFSRDGQSHDLTQLTPTEGTLFFMVNGDLWKTDGSSAGTALVRSFVGMQIRRIVAAGDRIYFFTGYDPIELWVSDGTSGGTLRVREVCAVNCFADVPFDGPLAESVESTLFFVASDAAAGKELWRSDGTAAGTGMVSDVLPGPLGSSPESLANVAGSLFFSAQDEAGTRALWVSDGVQAEPRKVKDIAAYGISSVNGKAFFIGFEETTGREPWVSDGSEQGTLPIADLCPGSCSAMDSLPLRRAFRESAGLAFFVGGWPYWGELWRSDGTGQGTTLVKTFSGGLSPLNGTGEQRFYFPASSEVWSTDGSPEGTIRLTDGSTEGGSNPSQPTRFNDGLYFTAYEDYWPETGSGTKLWYASAAAQDTLKAFEDEEPTGLTVLAGRLLFSSRGLWAMEAPGVPAVRLTNWRSGEIAVLNDVGYFDQEGELWRTDGTPSGTQLVMNVGSYLSELTVSRGLVFFTSQGALWRSDGTAAGTLLLKTAWAHGLFVFRDQIYFGTGFELWRTDGTVPGTMPVMSGLGSLDVLTVIGNHFFFVGGDEGGGSELWISDGTPQGTNRVKDIRPGPEGSMPPWLLESPWFTNVRGTLFFVADDGTHGRELWRSDGTEAGTLMVKDISPGPTPSVLSDLTNVYGTLFFAATDGLSGREVWRSDGTAEGTYLVQDIAPGPASSSPGSFAAVERTLFFKADDGETGSELWALDLPSHDVALLTRPSPGSALTGTTASFVWEAGDEASEYWLTVKNASSGKLIYSASEGTGLRRTVSGLPLDGSRLVVRLWSRLPSGWEVLDYSYTAAAPALAQLTSPAPGSTLTSSVTTFSWSPGVLVSAYWLQVGTNPGGKQVYNGSSVTTRTATVSGLPGDGSAIYVRLWSLVGTAWHSRDFTYTAVTAVTENARMISPPPESVLSGATVTFTWDPGSGVAAYWLDVGTTLGGTQISRGSRVTSLSTTVARIPTNGAPVYTRLWSEVAGRWSHNDYAYTAFSSISLAVGAVTVAPGEPVQVSVQGSPGNSRDWVGLYRSDSPESSYLDWQYLSGTRVPPAIGTTAARLTFTMPTVAGTYEFRLLANGGFTRLATSTRVMVAAVVPALRVRETTIGPGQPAHVTLENGPGNRTDWIGLFALGATDTGYLSWQYLNGTRTAPAAGLTAATLTFEMPTTPGAYEFRLFENNTYSRRASSSIVTVQ